MLERELNHRSVRAAQGEGVNCVQSVINAEVYFER